MVKKRLNVKKLGVFIGIILVILLVVIFGIKSLIDENNLRKTTDYKLSEIGYTANEISLIKELKKEHTVAYVGDGVNDVLALKESDCSIAPINGSDAAKNVSQIVLMDSNFDSMPTIVNEGRKAINNIERSASLFIVKTIYASLLALLFIFIDLKYPFIPIQLTLTSALTIGIPSFIIIISYIIYLKKAQEKDSKKEIIKTKEHVLLKFLVVGILMVIVSIFLTLIVNLIADKNPNVASSFIGAILLGITTSMPEVITFIALIKMKSFDLALSDIIGSNLFNLLILAIGDIFLKNKEIYYFVDKESMFLLVFGFILTILSFYQNNRKVVKNKLIYIIPSLIGVLLYIYYIVINV